MIKNLLNKIILMEIKKVIWYFLDLQFNPTFLDLIQLLLLWSMKIKFLLNHQMTILIM